MTAFTYMREPVPAEKTGQCPCCLKQHRSTASGTLVRHGWKETGRRIGSYGNGFQWGNCVGWGKRPLEQTDADALVVLERLAESIEETREALKLHTKGADKYTHHFSVRLEHETPEKRAAKVAKVSETLSTAGYEFSSRETEERRQSFRVYYVKVQEFTVKVARGTDKFETGRYGADERVAIPSYASLQRSAVAELEQMLRSLEGQREEIKTAIKFHFANPSNGKADTKNKGKLVHFERTVVRPESSCAPGVTLAQRTSKRIVCGARRNTMGGFRHLLTSEDGPKVTCGKCRKGMTDEERAQKKS